MSKSKTQEISDAEVKAGVQAIRKLGWGHPTDILVRAVLEAAQKVKALRGPG